MKLYDIGAGLILGLFVMGTAAKVNHDKTVDDLSKPETTVLEEPVCNAGPVYYIPKDVKNIEPILRNLKIGDTVVIVEPTTIDDTIIQDKVKVEKAAPSEPTPRPSWSFKPNENNPELNEVQKAIKNAVEKIIDSSEGTSKPTEGP